MTRRHIVIFSVLASFVVFAAAVFFYQRHTLQAAELKALEQAGPWFDHIRH
jgi:hypothetical protein